MKTKIKPAVKLAVKLAVKSTAQAVILTSLNIFIATILSYTLITGHFSYGATFKAEKTPEFYAEAMLLKSVTLQNDDKTETQMAAVSHALRKKAIFGLVPVNIYVLQLLAAKPDKLVKTEEDFLASLKEAGPIQLHFTFLRNLSGKRVTDSFKEGLVANKIDIKKLPAELAQVLKEISAISEIKNKENLSITISWSKNEATVYLADASDKVISIVGSKDFAEQLLSIWFGKMADSKLEVLKKNLIK